MEHIIDKNFDFVTKQTIDNADIPISNNWRVKTKDGNVRAITTNVLNGLKIDALFREDLGYIYVRQLIQDAKRFSGKTMEAKIIMSRDSWQPLKQDVYISARFSADDADRITLVDTANSPLNSGTNIITVQFTVPNILSRTITEDNALSVAFRLIGQNQNTSCTINSISVKEV